MNATVVDASADAGVVAAVPVEAEADVVVAVLVESFRSTASIGLSYY